MDVRTFGNWYWDELVATDPLLGTQVGDDRLDDRLPDLSVDGIERRRQLHLSAMRTIRELKAEAADRWDRLILDESRRLAEERRATSGAVTSVFVAT